MQATIIKYMGLLESPNPLKMLLMILYAVIKGIPIKQMVRYAVVPSTASTGVDIMLTTGDTASTNTRVRITATFPV